jgi:hypothetical protein
MEARASSGSEKPKPFLLLFASSRDMIGRVRSTPLTTANPYQSLYDENNEEVLVIDVPQEDGTAY